MLAECLVWELESSESSVGVLKSKDPRRYLGFKLVAMLSWFKRAKESKVQGTEESEKI